MGTQVELFNGYVPSLPDKEQLSEVFKRIADFQAKAYAAPDRNFIKKTPDNNAEYLVTSHIENRLDELYSGLWSTTNFRYSQIANEIVGVITLRVFHPECGVWIEREGLGAIQIMVDKCPANENKNEWALNLSNKKANALFMGFPKLKAECIKNAAKSLGDTFGRNLNRSVSDSDYNPDAYQDETETLRDVVQELFEKVKQLPIEKQLPQVQMESISTLLNDSKTNHVRLMGLQTTLKRLLA